MHPSHQVDKTYLVTVKNFSEQALCRLARPMTLDGYKLQIPQVRVLTQQPEVTLLFTIHEGRNRQVRRMCAIAGMQVKRLVRVQEGPLKLGELQPGKWRYLTQEEVSLL